MTNTVIYWVNTLGKDQPEQLTLRDRKGQLTGEVKITGVYEESTETPQHIKKLENNDLDQSDVVN